MIEVIDLTKIYKRRSSTKKTFEKISALNHINLNIKKGEILGLIGPNGAGKTTTMKILSTLILPDSGTAKINGYDVINQPDIIKSQVGILAGEFNRSLYWRISGRKNLRFFAKIKEIWDPDSRIDEIVEIFGLKNYENEQVMKYSTGMKHKLALAISMLNDPPVLLLDEPLTGIDPVNAYDIKQIIKKKFSDKTIIWASHNLFEIEEMCDKIAFIKNGKIILQGDPKNLKKDYWSHKKIIIHCDKPKLFESFKNATLKENLVEIKTENVTKTMKEIMNFVKRFKINILDFKTTSPSLEDIFMEKIKND